MELPLSLLWLSVSVYEELMTKFWFLCESFLQMASVSLSLLWPGRSVGGEMLLCWDSCSAPLPIVHFRWHHLSGRSWRDTHHASQIGWGKGLIYFLYITLTYTLLLTIQPPCFLAAAWVSEAAASITGRRGASCLTHPSLLSISRGRRGPLLALWPETERSQGLTMKTSQWKLGDELCLWFFFFFSSVFCSLFTYSGWGITQTLYW